MLEEKDLSDEIPREDQDYKPATKRRFNRSRTQKCSALAPETRPVKSLCKQRNQPNQGSSPKRTFFVLDNPRLTDYIINIIQTNEVIMTQEDFNNTIIEIANKIFLIREYSYQRRGCKFDPRRPDLLLSPCEKERIQALEEQALKTVETFKAHR